MSWAQHYDALGAWSAPVAAVPLVVLLGALGLLRVRAPVAALAGLVAALGIAVAGFGMPAAAALAAACFGAAYGLWPIGWIILNIIFLYRLTKEAGQFAVLRGSVARLTADSRLQLLLVAFCFGAFFEGAAGFGAPVAISGAMLIGLGFRPLQAAALSLIANTAPVAFGALGIQTIALANASGLPLDALAAMVGRIMTPFCLLVPAWLLITYCGWRRALEVWPAALVVGSSYALAQLALSNLHGPWLAAIVPALVAAVALVLLLRVWQPRTTLVPAGPAASDGDPGGVVLRAWLPWLLLTAAVFVWGLPSVRDTLDSATRLTLAVPTLDGVVVRTPPVVAQAAAEPARFVFNPLSATGTAILVAAIAGGLALGVRPAALLRGYGRAIIAILPSLATIAAMLALGNVTRFSGMDATMGLAFAATGLLYPWFGTLLGWLGTAATGSDTASNVLFGGLQRVTAEQLHLSPVLMAAANSSGGVMGKMIDAQSIVVASTATGWFGQEGRILRAVFLHSLVLAALVGLSVMLFAYVPPFTNLVTR